MALLPVVDSLDKVAEALRPEYESHTDGKFYLKLDGEPPGYVRREKHDEFARSNTELTRQRDAAQAEAAKYKDIDPEKARAALTRVQELEGKKLLDQGEYEKALQLQLDTLRGELKPQLDSALAGKEKAEQLSVARGKLIADRYLTDSVRELFPTAGVKQIHEEDVMLAAASAFSCTENDKGQFELTYTGLGRDTNGHAFTLKTWLDARRADRGWFEPSTGAGVPGSTVPARGAGGKLRISAHDQPNLRKYQDQIAKGEVEVYFEDS